MAKKPNYTCNDYREEMILLGLRKRLHSEELTEEEKKKLIEEIKRLETEMDMA